MLIILTLISTASQTDFKTNLHTSSPNYSAKQSKEKQRSALLFKQSALMHELGWWPSPLPSFSLMCSYCCWFSAHKRRIHDHFCCWPIYWLAIHNRPHLLYWTWMKFFQSLYWGLAWEVVSAQLVPLSLLRWVRSKVFKKQSKHRQDVWNHIDTNNLIHELCNECALYFNTIY